MITDQSFSVSQSVIASWSTELQVWLGIALVGNTCRVALDLTVQKYV